MLGHNIDWFRASVAIKADQPLVMQRTIQLTVKQVCSTHKIHIANTSGYLCQISFSCAGSLAIMIT